MICSSSRAKVLSTRKLLGLQGSEDGTKTLGQILTNQAYKKSKGRLKNPSGNLSSLI